MPEIRNAAKLISLKKGKIAMTLEQYQAATGLLMFGWALAVIPPMPPASAAKNGINDL